MKRVFGMMLGAAGIMTSSVAVAQTPQPTSDLRQLVEAMQTVVAPCEYEPAICAMPMQVRGVSGRDSTLHRPMQKKPSFLPLMLNGRLLHPDSLNLYTLQDVSSVTLNQDKTFLALYGARAAQGIIEIKLKSVNNQPLRKRLR